MGFGGIGIWQLLIVLVIIVLLFGTKKLRNMGGDIGSALKNFRKAMRDSDEQAESQLEEKDKEEEEGRIIDAKNMQGKDKNKVS